MHKPETGTARRPPAPRNAARRLLMCAGFMMCALVPLAASVGRASVSVDGVRGSSAVWGSTLLTLQGREFSTFSHATEAHKSLACASCHSRAANNSPQPSLPGHKACTSCHLPQFVTPNVPMCAICHTSLEGSNPPVKAFPGLRNFNAKFDHAQHMTGAARPESGCASCHAPLRRGVALSIPAGLAAHSNCYQCHTPNAQANGRDIASCGVCHDLARYSRTPTSARAFQVNFSHREHGPRQGLNCTACHTVRAGLPQGRQVSSPRPVQHLAARAESCATCHDNRRAFGGTDFSDCKRCHTGPTFRFGR